jgi:hypothetical protein
MRTTALFLPLLAATYGAAPLLHAQTAISVSATLKLAPSSYLTPTALPPNAQIYLRAIGNRLQSPGNERMTLTGTTTDPHGTGAAVLVWQLPGSVSLTRAASPNAAIVFLPTSGAVNASALAQADQDVLEDLSSGTHEAFLYSFTQKLGHRLLGTRFRTDDGKTPNYTGPYYDIYENFGAVPAANSAVRQKWFYFDSATGLLMKVRYLVNRGGADLTVETQYSGWTTQNGQPYPAQIVRTENGAAVFTFKTGLAAFGPALNDAVFAGH